MIWLIAKKEFFLNLISARFFIGLLLCVLLIPLTVYVGVDDYKNQERAYKIEEKNAENDLNNAVVWSGVRPTVVKKPEKLSIFSSGISGNIGNKTKIEIGEYPLFLEGNAKTRDNPFLNTFFTFDFTRVLAILLSLLALIFSYDAISKEKENGTLKLTMTGNLTRIKFLVGKILGIVLVLLPILLICFIITLLILQFNHEIGFTGEDWIKVFIIFIVSILYMLFFILLGTLVSSMVKYSFTSIIISLMLWVCFLFLVPNIANSTSLSLSKIPLYYNLRMEMNNYNKEMYENLWEQVDKWVEEGITSGNSIYFIHNSGNDGFDYIVGASKETAYKHIRKNTWLFPEMVKNSDRKWIKQKVYLDNLVNQAKLQKNISFFSPSEIYRNINNILSGTDSDYFLDYMNQVRIYREQVINYFVINKLYEKPIYFTFNDIEKYPSEKELASPDFDFDIDIYYNDKTYAVDLAEFPIFEYKPMKLDVIIKNVSLQISLLLIAMILIFGCNVWLINRYDVR